MKNKSVNIYGVVGHNFGDEAIAVAADKEIRRLAPTAAVTVASSARRGLHELYGIHELKNDRRSVRGVIEFVNSVRQSDVVLIGGGTLVQDKLGLGLLRGNLAYSLQIALLAKLFRKPVGTLAIGVDELGTGRGRTFARWFLRLLDVVLVRDEQSMALAMRYLNRGDGTGAARSRWHVGADPAFLIEADGAGSAVQVRFSNYLLLSLVNEGIDWQPFLDQLEPCVTQLIKDGVIDGVVLLAMDDRPSEELSIFQAWRAKFPHLEAVTQLHVPRDVHDAAHVIRHAKLMVAARLHAMILGLGSVPFLALSRTTKTENFLNYTHAIGMEAGSSVPQSDLTTMLTGILEDSANLARQKEIAAGLKSSARAGIQQLLNGLAVPAAVRAGRLGTP